jgi:hypothetical protein
VKDNPGARYTDRYHPTGRVGHDDTWDGDVGAAVMRVVNTVLAAGALVVIAALLLLSPQTILELMR